MKDGSVYITHSPEETEEVGKKIAEGIKKGGVIALRGGLGAGKTCFVRGLAAGLGFNGDVSSPTFAIINEYVGGRLLLCHFDMYRVTGWEDLYSTGYFDYLDAGALLAVEWSENIAAALPEKHFTVTITELDDGSREIRTEGEI